MAEEARDTQNTTSTPLCSNSTNSYEFLGLGGVMRAIIGCLGFEKPSSSKETSYSANTYDSSSVQGLVIVELGPETGASGADGGPQQGLVILEPGFETGGNGGGSGGGDGGNGSSVGGRDGGDSTSAAEAGPIYPVMPETRMKPTGPVISRGRDPAHH